jgi:hypothetical protein
MSYKGVLWGWRVLANKKNKHPKWVFIFYTV